MKEQKTKCTDVHRRRFLTRFSALGLTASLFPKAIGEALAAESEITLANLHACGYVAGLEFSDEEGKMMLEGVGRLRQAFEDIRKINIPNQVPPALQFNPALAENYGNSVSRPPRWSRVQIDAAPANIEEAAFMSVTSLAALIRARLVSSVDLTRMYIERLKRYDATLHCVVNLTEERALAQARNADRELAAGRYRGPLHGIPWGVKDLFSVRGYPTTWGAMPYKEQVIDFDATVVQRLDAAGAVLIGKLSLGALAMGDVWFGEKTRNPWNPEQGSSGSSAGSAAATAAGLVGFSIGTETLGSIISPSTRCGVTGLRPTFGRVSRHGAMALSWSMDKIGPICRSVEDCAMVFDAICGADSEDPTAVDRPFSWHPAADLSRLRIGYVPELFAEKPEQSERMESWNFNQDSVFTLRRLGIDLIPFKLPQLPVQPLRFILSAEAAAAFDELTRGKDDDLLVRQGEGAWPNSFRTARMIPAVEYIQANRVRTMVIREMNQLMEGIDVYVTPSFGGSNLLLTNLTGHPSVVLPNGFRRNGSPSSITFTGRLYGEADLLAVAKAYQDATDFHLRRPQGFVG